MAAPVLAPKGSTALLKPSLGLYLDRPPLQIPDQGMTDCLNVRLKEGDVRNENMGWATFPPDTGSNSPINLDSADVLLIDQFILRSGLSYLILANRYDLFLYDDNLETISYITPLYTAGTVSGIVFGGPDSTVTGVGTAWDTTTTARNGLTNVIVGDWIHFGTANEQSQTATWYQVTSVDSPTQIQVAGDASSEATGAYTVRQTFTGDVENCWYTATFPSADTGSGFEDRWYATNGIDSVIGYKGPTVTPNGAYYTDLGFTCRTLLYDNNMMLYMNLVESGADKPQAVRNSDIAFPEVVDGTGFSSEFTVVNGTDPILRAKTLGDIVVVYGGGKGSISTMQFVGDPFIYAVRTAVTNRGLFAEGSLADFGNFHEILSSDTVYRFDGVGINEYASHVWREVLRTMAPNRVNRALTHIDEENGEVQWVVPLTTDDTGDMGAATTAYTEHYLEEVGGAPTPFTIRDLPATAMGFHDRQTTLTWDDIQEQWQNANFRWNDRFFAASFPFSLFGDSNGYVFILNSRDHQQDGASTALPIQSFWRTPRRATSDGNNNGLVQRIEPYASIRASAAYSLGVEVHGTDRAQGDTSLLSFSGFNLTGSGNRFVSPRAATRYVEVVFGTTGIDRPWEMGGFGMTVRAMGSR